MPETTIDVAVLRQMLNEERPVTVLDVRTADDRAEWAIPGSLHVDAYDALRAGDPYALDGLDLPHDRPVVAVCGEGVTSLIAAEQLRERGLQVLSLAGGMKAWSLAWNSAEVPLPASQTRVIQVRRTGKGCLSYLIGSQGVAAVVDPALEPDVYLGLAQDHGWSITHVLDTHVHADHLSRARVLAEASGARLHLPAQERVAYPFHALRDGDVLTIGAARLQAIHTPGHTEESASYMLDGQALMTGDTLFLEAVGRPDLEASPDQARARAHLLYHSLQRLLALPPATLILPGHTGAPVAFDDIPLTAPLDEITRQIKALALSEETFVAWLLAHIPPAPPHHDRIVKLNEAGLLPEGDPTDLEAGANRCAAM
jgi:glyoxylase-like metal-dependent hydrolase (beta-lactamase superfamily II)